MHPCKQRMQPFAKDPKVWSKKNQREREEYEGANREAKRGECPIM